MTQDQIVPPHPVVAIEITEKEILLNGDVISARDETADPYAVATHAVARRVALRSGSGSFIHAVRKFLRV